MKAEDIFEEHRKQIEEALEESGGFKIPRDVESRREAFQKFAQKICSVIGCEEKKEEMTDVLMNHFKIKHYTNDHGGLSTIEP